MEVIDIKILWAFFPGQILCPLNRGVPKERFHCKMQCNSDAIVFETYVTDDLTLNNVLDPAIRNYFRFPWWIEFLRQGEIKVLVQPHTVVRKNV